MRAGRTPRVCLSAIALLMLTASVAGQRDALHCVLPGRKPPRRAPLEEAAPGIWWHSAHEPPGS